MGTFLTPRQVARAIGVSEASVKRWCDKGTLPAMRTAGGHRRLPIDGVVRFVRQTGHPIVRPEILGLPPATGRSDESIEQARERMGRALEAGDEEQVRRMVLDHYLAGRTVCELCDQVIAPAFRDMGDRWEHGQTHVYEERRGCEACMRTLYALRGLLPALENGAPQAIGGALEGDPYALPTLMVELALREAGWRASSYGIGLPFSTLCEAIQTVRPRLFWLSVSTIPSESEFLKGCAALSETATACGVPIVVGGRALTEDIRRAIPYTAHVDTLKHLISFAQLLGPSK